MPLYKEDIYPKCYDGRLEIPTMVVESPMSTMEPKLVELFIRMSRI